MVHGVCAPKIRNGSKSRRWVNTVYKDNNKYAASFKKYN
jgi:hypothetical protein